MEKAEASKYKVEFTPTSKISFYEIVEYLYGVMTFERAEKVASDLLETALSLNTFYNRGALEQSLLGRYHEYRYLLFERSKKKYIKIIYFIDHIYRVVYTTDFFPTEKSELLLIERNQ